jgi:hypothetical protein
VVECVALEKQYVGNGIGGSNPPLSAIVNDKGFFLFIERGIIGLFKIF